MESAQSQSGQKLVIGGSILALAISVAATSWLPATLSGVFSTSFLPHRYCYLYDKKLIALHMGADGVIWLSYVAIALTLAYLVRRSRHEIPFSWMFLAFGTFIIACGFTHFMEIVVLWKPLYWLSGDVKLVTALASVVTAMALPPLVPQIRSMVTSATLSEERKLRLEKVNGELHNLSARLLRTQDEERRRIARELHDGVGQYLAAMKMTFDVALSDEEDLAVVRKSLINTRDLLERCTREIRTMSHLLHPPLLEEMGLSTAAHWYVKGFQERSGIQTNLDMPAQFDRLPGAVEVVLFRVLQESLTNVHRHSGSEVANLRFILNPTEVELTIEDHGKGIVNHQDGDGKVGVGIAGMRERVRELGGEFKFESVPGKTTIRVTLPLTEKVDYVSSGVVS